MQWMAQASVCIVTVCHKLMYTQLVESCAMMHGKTAAAEVAIPAQCVKPCLPEGINDNFALDTLDRVYNYCHSSWVQLLKALHMQA